MLFMLTLHRFDQVPIIQFVMEFFKTLANKLMIMSHIHKTLLKVKKVIKMPKKTISTSQRSAKHPFAGGNKQPIGLLEIIWGHKGIR